MLTILSMVSACTSLTNPTTSGSSTNNSHTSTSSTPKVYYVDITHGSDFNPGSQIQPWKTIQKAANTVHAGDSITVLAGTYNERVKVSHSGSQGSPIAFQAQGLVSLQGFTVKADFITIKGFQITDTPNADGDGVGIFVQGSSCDLENNYIFFATRGGILLYADPGNYAGTSNCIVRNNRLYRNSQYGIQVLGTDHLIEGNEIWDTIQYHPKWIDPPKWVDADGIRFFGSGHIFRRNFIHDISLSDPLNVNPHIDAFQTWDELGKPAGSNILFEGNTVNLDAGSTGFQLEGGTNNLLIMNNIISTFSGVNAYKNGNPPLTTPSNIYVVNNLFIGNLAYNTNAYPAGVSLYDTSNAVVKNNILTEQKGQAIYIDNSLADVDYNLAYNSDGSIPLGTRSSHSLWEYNPQFVDPQKGDFHLQPDSPAIDAGITLQISPFDKDGVTRPQGKSTDIGPYEFIP